MGEAGTGDGGGEGIGDCGVVLVLFVSVFFVCSGVSMIDLGQVVVF